MRTMIATGMLVLSAMIAPSALAAGDGDAAIPMLKRAHGIVTLTVVKTERGGGRFDGSARENPGPDGKFGRDDVPNDPNGKDDFNSYNDAPSWSSGRANSNEFGAGKGSATNRSF